MVTPVCVLRSGGDFRPEHVTRLAGMVPGLVCLSDVPIPDVPAKMLHRPWPKWWSKLCAFDPSIIAGDVLLIDLDTLVIRVPAMPTATTVLSDFYRPHLMGSGFMFLTEADRARCWQEFERDPEGHMRRCTTREAWGDQGFLNPIIGGSQRWGENVVSWKVHCQNGIPPSADVVCWHGQPRPWDCGH